MAGIQPQPKPTKQLWSLGETAELVAAWAPLYNRRRGGQSDVWVPPHQRNRALSSRELAPEDWRAVAAAVNGYLADSGLYHSRTPKQCKRRVLLLRGKYGDELAEPHFLPDLYLYDGGSDEAVGHGAGAVPHGRRASMASGHASPAVGGDAAGGDARGVTAAVAAGVSAAAAAAQGGSATGDGRGATAAQHPRASVATDEGAAAAWNLFGGAIPKRPRTGASTSAGAARAPSVKEELVRLANAGRGAVDEGRGGDDAGSALGGVAADGVDASVAALLAGRSDNAVVMTALGSIYLALESKRIELEKEKLKVAAAGAARDGGSAGALP